MRSCYQDNFALHQLCITPVHHLHLLSLLLALEIWSKTVQSDNCKGHPTPLSDKTIFFIETDVETFFETKIFKTKNETFLRTKFLKPRLRLFGTENETPKIIGTVPILRSLV